MSKILVMNVLFIEINCNSKIQNLMQIWYPAVVGGNAEITPIN
jgi:hypothetical protein